MKVVAIVQARMSSKRLPGKVLLPLQGKPLLLHLLLRLKKSREINEIVIATSINKTDEEIVEFAKKHNFSFFRGSEKDVLKRVLQAAKEFNAAHIVRVCADNPLIDAEELDSLIRHHIKKKADYSTNTLKIHPGLPIRLEIVSMPGLEKANAIAKLPEEREHVTTVIVKNKELFHIEEKRPGLWRPDLELDIDSTEDFERMKKIFSSIKKPIEEINAFEIAELIDARKKKV